jgi:hypothetical protein
VFEKRPGLSDLSCMAGMICIGLRHGGHCAEWDSSTDGWLNGSRRSY